MPRDKTESHIKVNIAIREEFMEKGFEGASIRSHGNLRYFIVMICLLIRRVMPGLIMGAYIFSTTTVSEFVAAMHLPGILFMTGKRK